MNTLLIGFLIGGVFGAILYMGGATSYRRILGTLLLKDMWIIKLMCTAIGVGTLGIYLLDLGGLANLSIKPAYLGGVALGGVIFGIGWAVSGYCPGTCVVGAAEGKFDAIFTLVGGLVGALIFAFMFNDCRRGPSVAGVPVFHPNGFSIFGIQNMDGRLSPIVSNQNQFALVQNR